MMYFMICMKWSVSYCTCTGWPTRRCDDRRRAQSWLLASPPSPRSRLVLRPTSTTTPPHRGPSSGGHPSSAACPSSTPSFLACPCSPQILGAWGRLTRARASHLGFRGTHASHGAMFRFVDFWGRFPVPKSHQKRLRKANRVRGFDMDGPTGSMTELGDLCQECVCSLGEV
jgi:hypothetical protein